MNEDKKTNKSEIENDDLSFGCDCSNCPFSCNEEEAKESIENEE